MFPLFKRCSVEYSAGLNRLTGVTQPEFFIASLIIFAGKRAVLALATTRSFGGALI